MGKKLAQRLFVFLGFHKYKTIDRDGNWRKRQCEWTGKIIYDTRMTRYTPPFRYTKFYESAD